MAHTAFFYGTLMAPPVLHRVIWGSSTPPTPVHASLLTIRPAMLPGYQRHKVKGADYPAILRADGSDGSVRGTLVSGLNDGDMWRLDVFEGSEYTRARVRVKVLKGNNNTTMKSKSNKETNGEKENKDEDKNEEEEEEEAETYIWTADPHRLEAQEWDFDEFVRDKMKRWVGREAADADEGFQDVDDAVAALQDPTGGRGVSGEISRQLNHGGKTEEKVLESAV